MRKYWVSLNVIGVHASSPSGSPRCTMAILFMMGFSILIVISALIMKVVLRKATGGLAETGKTNGQRVNHYTT